VFKLSEKTQEFQRQERRVDTKGENKKGGQKWESRVQRGVRRPNSTSGSQEKRGNMKKEKTIVDFYSTAKGKVTKKKGGTG